MLITTSTSLTCSSDGDKPSPLVGISLTTASFNLRQHGTYNSYVRHFYIIHNSNTFLLHIIFLIISNAIMDNGTFFSLCYGPPDSRRHQILGKFPNMVFARIFPKEECGYLECLIHEHHYNFKEIYPDVSITIKMHSMVHLPRLILE